MDKNKVKETEFLLCERIFDIPGLTINDKIVLICLTRNQRDGAFCNNKSYDYLALQCSISKSTLFTSINTLLEKNLIIKLSNEEKISMLKSKNLHGKGIGTHKCTWCGLNTFAMHKHHWPIQKEKGGVDVIDLCPTCHMEYHSNILIVVNQCEKCVSLDTCGGIKYE